jgi:hypothetical protein
VGIISNGVKRTPVNISTFSGIPKGKNKAYLYGGIYG